MHQRQNDEPAHALRRRHWLAGSLAVLALPRALAASDPALPLSVSLADELANAQRAGKPLVVMVSLEGCVFCRAVRRSHLAPMREQQGLAVVQVDMQSARKTRDFNGKETTHGELVKSWRVELAPTVLFIGRGGAEVAERLTGSYLPDFYGAYLDDRLSAAQARIRG